MRLLPGQGSVLIFGQKIADTKTKIKGLIWRLMLAT